MYGIDYYIFVGNQVQVDVKLTRLNTLYDGSCYKISVPRNLSLTKKHHTPEAPVRVCTGNYSEVLICVTIWTHIKQTCERHTNTSPMRLTVKRAKASSGRWTSISKVSSQMGLRALREIIFVLYLQQSRGIPIICGKYAQDSTQIYLLRVLSHASELTSISTMGEAP